MAAIVAQLDWNKFRRLFGREKLKSRTRRLDQLR